MLVQKFDKFLQSVDLKSYRDICQVSQRCLHFLSIR